VAVVISVGAAVGAGFGLIRRKPLAILAWGLILALALGLVIAAYANLLTNMVGFTATQNAGVQPSASQTSAMIGFMLMGQGEIFLAIIALVLVRTIVTTAVWRAVIHPEQGSWAYLRVGMAELFVFLINMAVGFLANLAVLPLMPLLLIVGALLAFHQYVAAVIVGVLAVIAVIVGIIYVELRFALLGPMIVHDDRFHFFDAWRLSRGKVGGLFLIGLCLAGIVVAAEVLAIALTFGAGAAALYLAAGGFNELQGFFQQPPPLIASKLWPLAALWALVAVPAAGALSAILCAPWARVYRDLTTGPATPLPTPTPAA
jgi:hypothetical protein